MLGADLTTHAIRTEASLPLPKTGHPDVTYTWQTSDASVMDENGTVTPSKVERNVTLTATIRTVLDGSYAQTVTFPVTVLDTYAFWLEEVYKKLSIRNLDDVRGSLYLPMSDERYPEVQISWKSDHTYIISDAEKNGIAPGLVTRPAADTDVKLTAVLSVGEGDERQEKTKEFTAKVKKKAQVGELTDYMFAYFIGEGTKTGEQMYFADSRDGLHWTALNDGEPVITSSMGEKGLRDPFIMRSHEGDKFYLIATDLWIAGGTSWGDSQTKGSKSIMVWASKTSLDGYGPHHIWKCHTRDFYTYSEPEIWITLKNAGGNDISVIDTTVIKAGDTYYRFNKNEDVETDTWCLLLDNFGGGGYYPATTTDLASGKSVKFGSGSWLDVKTKGGHSLLTGVESMSISYYSKAEDPNKDGAGWAFFAAPDDRAPEYNKSENYLGILDHVGEVKAERYHGTRGSATSTSTLASSLENTWRHVVVSYTPKGVRIYIDGTLKATVSKRRLSALSDLLGDSSILQLGKGNWGGGEYFNGYMDDVTIYNRALTQEEVTAIYEGRVLMPDPEPDVPTYTVTFDPDGGTLAGAGFVEVDEGGTISRPADPTRSGFTFLGWSREKGGTVYWNFETDTVSENLTLYACWKSGEGPVDPGPDEPGPDEPGKEEWGDILPEDRPASVEAVPNGLWIAGVEEQGYTYTGKAVKPEVRVYNHKTRLTLKTDYTIAYKNNVKASDASDAKTAPTITVTGKGNYTGKDTVCFKIQPKDIGNEDISIFDIAVAYKNNKVQKPVPVVKWNGKKLANKKDFTVKYPDGKEEEPEQKKEYSDPGDWRIVVTGTGNFAGTREITLTIADKDARLTEKLSVKKIPNQTYTGTPLMPELEVKDGRTLLTAGEHYDVVYENNKEIGTATVVITGKTKAAEDEDPGFSYVGEKRVTFQIVGENIGKAKVTEGLEKSYVYTGREIKPAPGLSVSVKEDGATVSKPLVPDEDYTVKYMNNTKVGTATILFTGKGAYTGTLKKTFKISAYDIGTDVSERLLIEDMGEVPYAKGGSKPKPVVTYKIGGDLQDCTSGYRKAGNTGCRQSLPE